MGSVPNYDASVPGLDSGTAAPFNVKVDPNKPPGDRFQDFKPKDPSVVVKPSDTIKRKEFMRAPVARYETDYIPPNLASQKRQREKEAIKVLAQQIYAEGKKERSAYAKAQKMFDAATDMEKANPDDELRRAMKILKRLKPLSKREALEKASKQYYGLTV